MHPRFVQHHAVFRQFWANFRLRAPGVETLLSPPTKILDLHLVSALPQSEFHMVYNSWNAYSLTPPHFIDLKWGVGPTRKILLQAGNSPTFSFCVQIQIMCLIPEDCSGICLLHQCVLCQMIFLWHLMEKVSGADPEMWCWPNRWA